MARLSSEVVLAGWHREVTAIVKSLSSKFEDHVVAGSREVFLSNFLVELFGVHAESSLMLVTRHVSIVESNSSTGNHRHFNLVSLLDLVKELLESHGTLLDFNLIKNSESFWDGFNRSTHDRVVLNCVSFLNWIRLSE
jgi:hypothetical protein